MAFLLSLRKSEVDGKRSVVVWAVVRSRGFFSPSHFNYQLGASLDTAESFKTEEKLGPGFLRLSTLPENYGFVKILGLHLEAFHIYPQTIILPGGERTFY